MIGHYLLTAVRNIRRHRTNAALKFLALTFGLTCFLSAYVVSDYFANTDRQFANSDRIAVVRQKIIWPYSNIAFPFFVATAAPVAKYLKAEVPELPAVARRMSLGEIAVRTSAHKSYRQVQAVDADFLKIFGLPFVAGDAVDALASPKSAVISEEAANAIFGTKEVLGRRLTLQNQTDVTITGVTAAIKGPSHLSRTIASRPFDLLVSMDVGDALFPTVMGRPGSTTPWSELEDWTSNTFTTYALLPEGGTLSIRDLNARLQGFGARHIPISAGGGEFDAIPVSDYMLSRTDTLTLEDAFGLPLTTILYVLGGLILAISCLDFINLATAESTGHAKEVGLRKTLGATRGQIVAQSLTEAFLLAGGALVLALLLMAVIIILLDRPVDLGFRLPSFARPQFWLFLVSLLATVGLVAGTYPALVLAGIRPVFTLRSSAMRGGSGLLRALLVGMQFAVASFLLISVFFVYAQMSTLRGTALGRFGDPLLLISTPLTTAKIDPETFRRELLADPHIKSMTGMERPLWSGYSSLEDFAASDDPAAKRLTLQRLSVSYDYFPTLGIRLLAGRGLVPGDELSPPSADAPAFAMPANVVVDQATAAKFGWANPGDAIGKVIFEEVPVREGAEMRSRPVAVTIVGVSENAPFQIGEGGSSAYVYSLSPEIAAQSVIRIDRSAVGEAVAHINAVWDKLAPDVPMQSSFADMRFEEAIGNYTVMYRTAIGLALFSIVIAVMGLWGISVYVVGRRTREIGVRKTLGASTRQILFMLLAEFSKPVLVANLIVWPAAYLAAKAYLSLFVTRIALTPTPFALSLLLTLLIAWAAVLSQAWRAAHVKPAKVLRHE